MLDCALLALTNKRCASQNHRQQREVVDDLHHRSEPARLQVWIEFCAHNHFDRDVEASFASCEEICDLAVYDALDVNGAVAGLRYGCGVDVHLDRRPPPGENIGLEVRRDFNAEDETFRIHRRVNLRRRDVGDRFEQRRSEAIRNLP